MAPALELEFGELERRPSQQVCLPSGAHDRGTPVDATHLPEEQTGLRTIFEGLHDVIEATLPACRRLDQRSMSFIIGAP